MHIGTPWLGKSMNGRPRWIRNTEADNKKLAGRVGLSWAELGMVRKPSRYGQSAPNPKGSKQGLDGPVRSCTTLKGLRLLVAFM